MEQTFMMVKPDGVQRGLVGNVISRMEKKGYQLVAAKLVHVDKDLAQRHYEELSSKPFFSELVSFITSSPVFAMIWRGEGVIAETRKMMGATNPADAAPGTIRGDLAVSVGQNVVHGSDSPASAEREIKIWFNSADILAYEKDISRWV